MGCSVATVQSCWVFRSATQQPSNSALSRRVSERRAAGCGEECAAIGVRLLAQPSLHRFDGGLRTALTRHFLPDEAKIATLELAGCPMLLSGCPNTTGPAKSGAVLFFKRRVVYLPFCACHRFTQPSIPPQNRLSILPSVAMRHRARSTCRARSVGWRGRCIDRIESW
jgi:hypothetical protein